MRFFLFRFFAAFKGHFVTFRGGTRPVSGCFVATDPSVFYAESLGHTRSLFKSV